MAADITASVPVSPWWGWAPYVPGGALTPATRRVLAERLGVDPKATIAPPPPPPSERDVPPPALSAAALAALRAAVPDGEVTQDPGERVRHAAGKHTPDLLRQRAGTPLAVPDAVVAAGTRHEVPGLLAACVAHDVAVVPFGGGSSVVGGVTPLRGNHHAVIALDLTRLDALLVLNEHDRTATFEAGIRGPALEAALAQRGFTLGHIPQSHQQATLGGYAATRSAGQASTGYGAIADLITAIRIETPSGPLTAGGRAPASAAGPDLRHLVIGSEGTLGVITEVTVAITRRPTRKHYGAWAFPSFEAGARAVRALAQDGAAGDLPDVCRLSDEEETELTLAQSDGRPVQLLRGWLRARGIHTPALLLGVWEGTSRDVTRRAKRAARILRAYGGVSATSAPAAAWDRGRFSAPRLRDELLTIGVMVDTLETAATWSQLDATHRAVAEAIRGALAGGPSPAGPLADAARPCAVQGHISHVYRDGASLYYTFIAEAEDDPIAQYARVKDAANAAILSAGATITHHHAVGTEHAALLPDEIGEAGVRTLQAAKAALDPSGIMNPGKLVEPPAAGRESEATVRNISPATVIPGATVLITGAARGMGELYARRAAREGAAAIALWDLDGERAEHLAAELRRAPGRGSAKGTDVRAYTVDVSDREAVRAAAERVREDLGAPDVLVNNAGIVRGALFWEHDAERDIELTMRVNTLAPMWLTREFLPDMITDRSRPKRILNIASAAGTLPNPRMSVYASSKWAMIGWSESLRLELTREGHGHILVTTFCPSYISTGMFAGARGPLFTPIMQPRQAVRAAWRGMLRGTPMVLRPWTVKLAMLARGVLPTRAWDVMADRVFHVYSSMDEFTGRD